MLNPPTASCTAAWGPGRPPGSSPRCVPVPQGAAGTRGAGEEARSIPAPASPGTEDGEGAREEARTRGGGGRTSPRALLLRRGAAAAPCPAARGTAGSEGAGLGIPAPRAGTAEQLTRGKRSRLPPLGAGRRLPHRSPPQEPCLPREPLSAASLALPGQDGEVAPSRPPGAEGTLARWGGAGTKGKDEGGRRCPLSGRRAHEEQVNSARTPGNAFLLRGRPRSAAACSGRLWGLRRWRGSEPSGTRPWAAGSSGTRAVRAPCQPQPPRGSVWGTDPQPPQRDPPSTAKGNAEGNH